MASTLLRLAVVVGMVILLLALAVPAFAAGRGKPDTWCGNGGCDSTPKDCHAVADHCKPLWFV